MLRTAHVTFAQLTTARLHSRSQPLGRDGPIRSPPEGRTELQQKKPNFSQTTLFSRAELTALNCLPPSLRIVDNHRAILLRG